MTRANKSSQGNRIESTPGLRSRIFSGAWAQLFNVFVRAVDQIGSLAILLPIWGLERYGEWLMLYALMGAFAFSDLGYFTAARNEMVMAVGRNDLRHAADVYRSVYRGMRFIVLIIVLLLPPLAWALPVASWLHLTSISEVTASWTVVVMGLNILLICGSGLIVGGFACVGRYGEGMFWKALLALAEFISLVAAVVLTKHPGVAALSMFLTRLVGTAAMYAVMQKRAPWLTAEHTVVESKILRRLTGSAMTFAVLPLALAINVQGMLLVVGVVLGPASVAVFSSVRTISRIVIQLLSAISSVIAPEFARAFGEGHVELMRQLHRQGSRFAFWLSLPIVALLSAFGLSMLRIWTSGKVDADAGLLFIFLGTVSVDALWYASFVVLYSTNRHQKIAWVFFLTHLASLPAAYILLGWYGLEGAAAVLLSAEIFMLCVTLRQSIPAAGDRWWPWFFTVISPPTVSMVRAMLHRAK